jgi:hypothetical protein
MLRAEVVRDELVVAGERVDVVRARLLHEERSEMEAGDPALGPFVQPARLRLRHRRARRAEDGVCLRVGDREVGGAELEEAAIGTDPRERKPVVRAAREDELRARRQMLGDRLQRVDAVVVAKLVDVVEDEHDRLWHRGQRGPEARQRRRPERVARRRSAAENGAVDGADPVERRGDVREERNRVVVPLLQRHPGERPWITFRPLGEQCGLPVARRRRDADHPRLRSAAEPVDERSPVDQPRAQRGDREL